jgi:hypothetical protein
MAAPEAAHASQIDGITAWMTSCRLFRLVVNGTYGSPNGGVDIFEFDADAGGSVDSGHARQEVSDAILSVGGHPLPIPHEGSFVANIANALRQWMSPKEKWD